jgi:hypothetical protein
MVLGTSAALILASVVGDTVLSPAPSTSTRARAEPAVVGSPGRGPAGFLPPAATEAGTADPPTRLRIRAIHVDTPLERLRLDATGALETPKDYAHAGWFAGGSAPGDVGPAVIAGHVDSTTGPAVFFRLDRLRPGDVVEVARAAGWVGFRVVEVSRYPKDRFPTTRVYGPTPDPQLRLITCSGAFDSAQRSYVDNTVVYAVAT